MNYSCRACQYEEQRGCLPGATCGMYLIVLLALSFVCIMLVTRALVGLRPVPVEPRPVPAEPVDVPWWASAIAIALGMGLTVIGAVVLNLVLELAEWLAFARRRCPVCGARRWSWGFTQGFGL